ncbi:uncharacterized protein LOC110364253 isoform X2 [Columba livia]|uniref:uncharacterized protein LOC110364253 isoform X2 n=1 Tax=Columba livia TaxID=8932 RepID=UPI0031BAF647
MGFWTMGKGVYGDLGGSWAGTLTPSDALRTWTLCAVSFTFLKLSSQDQRTGTSSLARHLTQVKGDLSLLSKKDPSSGQPVNLGWPAKQHVLLLAQQQVKQHWDIAEACQVSKAGNILMIFLDWHHKDIVRACGEANGTASITSRAEKIGLLFREREASEDVSRLGLRRLRVFCSC